MREIQLTRGEIALVDDEDFGRTNALKWQAMPGHSGVYASHYFKDASGRRHHVPMHRFILGLPAGALVDHRNRNTLDNRKENLRVCSPSENCRNAKNRRGSSEFKGVYFHRQHRKWAASLQVDKRRVHLGLFSSASEAAAAYDAAAIVLHGPFALTNRALGLLPGEAQ